MGSYSYSYSFSYSYSYSWSYSYSHDWTDRPTIAPSSIPTFTPPPTIQGTIPVVLINLGLGGSLAQQTKTIEAVIAYLKNRLKLQSNGTCDPNPGWSSTQGQSS